jgi:hypothetical protein
MPSPARPAPPVWHNKYANVAAAARPPRQVFGRGEYQRRSVGASSGLFGCGCLTDGRIAGAACSTCWARGARGGHTPTTVHLPSVAAPVSIASAENQASAS